jgi:protein-tyrosine phosphatase
MTGKDRTGFAAAVLLEWLGVDRDTVIQDYMLTTELMGRMSPDRMRRILSLYGLDTADADGLLVLSEVRPEYLQASLDRIDDEFGGLRCYLRDYVGVPEAQLTATREHLLED